MSTQLTREAKGAFAAFTGLGKRILDDLIEEVERLTANNAKLLEAAHAALEVIDVGDRNTIDFIKTAIANAENDPSVFLPSHQHG